ncbi:MAG: hypothetical protein OSA97_18325 [Nevskia sp.]|nr:hypothetical protein [Nevskia sp.]
MSGIDGACDLEETCSGSDAACPADAYAVDGTSCDDENAATDDDECTLGLCGCPAGDDLDGDLVPDVCDALDAGFEISRAVVWPAGSKTGRLLVSGRMATGVYGAADVMDAGAGLTVAVVTESGVSETVEFTGDDCETRTTGRRPGSVRCRQSLSGYDRPELRLKALYSHGVATGSYKVRFKAGGLDSAETTDLGGPLTLTVTSGDIDRVAEIASGTTTRRGLICR